MSDIKFKSGEVQIIKGKFSFDEWFRNLNERLKKSEMICAEETQLREKLETFDSLQNFPAPTTYNAFEKKYHKSFRLHGLISQKYFSLKNISEDEFLNVTDRYFRLKDERNYNNHARNDIGEFETAKDLEQYN